jgi:glycosyltransferase involved in cell wall biosynthesis
MKIGIDARFYGAIGKGLGRYTQKLIENLEKISAQGGPASGWDNQYFIFLKKENFDDYDPKNNNFHKVLADYRWYTLSEQINMPRILNKYKLDLVHFPHFNVPLFYRKKFVITIHDLILLHFPTIRGTTLNPLFYWLKFLAYKIIIKSAIKRARRIIAVSNFTRNDILENYKVSPDKIAVTYEACDYFNTVPRDEDKEFIRNYGLLDENRGIIKRYILYVGNAYPHKNLEALVLAFSKVKEKNLHLVLIGKEDYFYKRLKKLTKGKNIRNIIFTDFVPDVGLSAIYRYAQFYIFPSLYEGFGLPPLEAMACGVPVASSNHSCLREILGESAYYFNAKDRKEIIKAIEELLKNEDLKNRLVRLGHERVKNYSWEKMARQTLKIYKN